MSVPTAAGSAPQFITVPLTGIQICRRLPLPPVPRESEKNIWDTTVQLAKSSAATVHPALPLIAKYIACDQQIQNTGWVSCSQSDAVFYRLLKIGANWAIDLVIDSQNGAGKVPSNRIACEIEIGLKFFKKKYLFANFYVEDNFQPKNIHGSLVMDFGNTGTSAIFSPVNTPPYGVRPIFFHNPFDIHEGNEQKRPQKEKCVLRSTTFLLRVPESELADPWIVLGKRAEELIASEDPLISSLYAPKKYVRFWPEHLKAHEPTIPFNGRLGQQLGLKPALQLVELGIQQMLELAISSLTNPHFASFHPECYPQIHEILLTYPLTWREVDKQLFKEMVSRVARKQFVLDSTVQNRFKVELVCSEPVAVASYAIWEPLFQHYHAGSPDLTLKAGGLAASLLGNVDGDPKLRLLMIDIGGGSTDIALVEAAWVVHQEKDQDSAVNVTLRVLESLRFNRAGDRLSHIIATAIWEFLCKKYGVTESLNFKAPSSNPAFTLGIKRQIVSEISRLVEQIKVHLSQNSAPWILDQSDEEILEELFSNATRVNSTADDGEAEELRLVITNRVLRSWVEADRQSMQTRGEPCFMDIFYYLKDVVASLAKTDRSPHMAILSGRTSRLDLIRDLTIRYTDLPYHRVRTLNELIPDELHGVDKENTDKLAVVLGAHRFRYGSPVNFRFIAGSGQDTFQRLIGTLQETPNGLRLNQVFVSHGESMPRTCKLKVGPNQTIRIGNSFRKDGLAEILATIVNESGTATEIEIDLLDDYHITMKKSKNTNSIHLVEWFPGGSNEIIDNFNDTGRIDDEPPGFLRKIVLTNLDQWMRPVNE